MAHQLGWCQKIALAIVAVALVAVAIGASDDEGASAQLATITSVVADDEDNVRVRIRVHHPCRLVTLIRFVPDGRDWVFVVGAAENATADYPVDIDRESSARAAEIRVFATPGIRGPDPVMELQDEKLFWLPKP